MDLTKKFYKIREVSELLGLPASTIRYWETEFDQLSPRRNDKGTRYFTPDD
ncbi:MAG: MerR family transcriptional regulator, partial [Muribaculaceae bacterium]|nr:MerR family transcriptional regulator [Muribaculaceae bacterium]